MKDDTPRWLYRFQNYKKAFSLLREAIEPEKELTQLEKEGGVQRFKFTFELAWKTMKDYLEGAGVTLPDRTPAAVIRAAFEFGLVLDCETWLEALDARDKMTPAYNLISFEQALADIAQSYLAVMYELFVFFSKKEVEYGG
ncbi:MAG: nucleotidyltransferase substrate binding protein [Deltaproteobacteria bacterium]|jgi:nucleotidyltransferase substrate binding protein (TIGR01987 family)|nr:nucleotidyltransferase substrate binding protein [Deltaproteobacteria bacterium]